MKFMLVSRTVVPQMLFSPHHEQFSLSSSSQGQEGSSCHRDTESFLQEPRWFKGILQFPYTKIRDHSTMWGCNQVNPNASETIDRKEENQVQVRVS